MGSGQHSRDRRLCGEGFPIGARLGARIKPLPPPHAHLHGTLLPRGFFQVVGVDLPGGPGRGSPDGELALAEGLALLIF
jgi:hypothetical protein